MLIAFAQTGENPFIGQFLASVAGNRLVHITDETTEALPGCEVVRLERGDTPFMLWRARAYAMLNEPGIYLDTDMIVMRDLSPIMALDFDVALTKRKTKIKDENGQSINGIMPYNGGLIAVKDTSFLPQCADMMEDMPEDWQRWYGDQIAIEWASKSRNVIELPAFLYNYTPRERIEKPINKWVLHFKGARKEWMRDYQNDACE